jgi:uncharacterized protein YjiS (DUF1127 family)
MEIDMFHGITATLAFPVPAPALRIGSHFVQGVRRAIATVLEWQQRGRERRQLASLDARMRRDLGLSNLDLWCEVNKPFWRP